MNELLLISLSGEDRPGVTAEVTAVLANYEVDILDMGQAVIHDTLTLGLLVEIPESAEHSPVVRDVLYKAHAMGLQARFTPIDAERYAHWVAGQGKPRHIVTVLARKLTAAHIARVSNMVRQHGLNIDGIRRLSGRIPQGEPRERSKAAVEFSVRGLPADLGAVRRDFLHIANELDVDIAFQEDSMFRRNRRLVCFDMDSTLIETEVIDELARAAGVGEQVAEITERAMRGELDFKESFQARVALLKGLDSGVLAGIAERLPITEGAEKLIGTLKRLGYRTAILSGGFTYFGNVLKQKLGIDYVYANELETVDGRVTGNVVGTVVDGERKAQLLRELAEREGISLEQVIAVGDGANDLPMLSIAGLGVAFRAKPIVKASAKQSISTLGLDGILYLIGLSDREASA